MSVFDLLLILLVLGSAGAIVAAGIALTCRKWRFARTMLVGLAVLWIVYLGAGTAVAILTPQRIMAIGEDRCFDEMCFAVIGFQRTATIGSGALAAKARGTYYIVDVRISNHGQGRAEREQGRKAVLLDQAGRVYEVSPEGQQALSGAEGALPGLDSAVAAGQSVNTRLVFDIPPDASRSSFALSSSLAFNPARIVIGDEMHFLHKPTIVPLG